MNVPFMQPCCSVFLDVIQVASHAISYKSQISISPQPYFSFLWLQFLTILLFTSVFISPAEAHFDLLCVFALSLRIVYTSWSETMLLNTNKMLRCNVKAGNTCFCRAEALCCDYWAFMFMLDKTWMLFSLARMRIICRYMHDVDVGVDVVILHVISFYFQRSYLFWLWAVSVTYDWYCAFQRLCVQL